MGRRRGSGAELGEDEDDDIIGKIFKEVLIVILVWVFHWSSHDDDDDDVIRI